MTTGQQLVDTHVHFWDHSVPGLSWAFLQPGFRHPRLGELWRLDAPRYCTQEFRDESAGRQVAKVVHVQAARAADPAAETAWLQRLHDATSWPSAVVGYCDLTAGDVAAVLRRHAAFPVFRGVRDLPAGDRLDHPALGRAFDAIAAAGCLVEVMTAHENFGRLLDLLRHRPELVCVLGHSGLPIRRDADYRRQWLAGLHRLARQPSVVCKVSALASGPDPHWSVASLRPWFAGCLEAFGARRCMFGSNWPIDRMFGSYPRLLDAYRELAAELSTGERDSFFRRTAEDVYRI